LTFARLGVVSFICQPRKPSTSSWIGVDGLSASWAARAAARPSADEIADSVPRH
jgi:hypothetical protein